MFIKISAFSDRECTRSRTYRFNLKKVFRYENQDNNSIYIIQPNYSEVLYFKTEEERDKNLNYLDLLCVNE